MANPVISVEIPEAEVTEAQEAAVWFTGLPKTATPKEMTAGVFNEVIRKFREQTKQQPKGGIK